MTANFGRHVRVRLVTGWEELLKRLGQGWEVSLELGDDSFLMMKLNLPMGD